MTFSSLKMSQVYQIIFSYRSAHSNSHILKVFSNNLLLHHTLNILIRAQVTNVLYTIRKH